MAEPIMKTVFSGESSGYTMLMSLAYVAVFTTGVFTMQGVLQGSGMFYKPLKNLAWGALIKLLLNIALISNQDIGIYGAVYSSLIASFVIFVLNFIDVKRHVGIEKITGKILKTLIASGVMGVFAVVGYNFLENFISYRLAVLVTIFASGYPIRCIDLLYKGSDKTRYS